MLYVDRILYSSVIYPANYGKKGERERKRKRESFPLVDLEKPET